MSAQQLASETCYRAPRPFAQRRPHLVDGRRSNSTATQWQQHASAEGSQDTQIDNLLCLPKLSGYGRSNNMLVMWCQQWNMPKGLPGRG
jgi:hypothetical protein